MRLPTKLGQPCWSADAIPTAITSIARLDPKLTHYFLATHAPVEHLVDDQAGTTVSEHGLYERLMNTSRGDVLALVHGDPGTGKSHLIRALHLRCQQEIEERKRQNLLPVLVQRRTGSLRDALTQIVEQLPEGFARYLTQVRHAIGKLSDDTAREMLANALQLEFGPRWASAGDRPPRPAELRALDQVCLSAGFRAWLCRDGGVIDRVIRQLTEESEAADRQTLPEFTGAEFDLPRDFQANNTRAASDLIDEFEFTPGLKDRAAGYLNLVSRAAVNAMSGLSGTALRDVFDNIRRELKQEGKALAVFVEDVSIMASLDDDILNAVEPNPSPDLCKLIAVIGMTEGGFARLRDNQYARATDIISSGGDATTDWRSKPSSVARFAARYLNVVRLDEPDVKRIAADRSVGGDVSVSACTRCPVREECHQTFGAVDFEGIAVGVFPFTLEAPRQLLRALDERRKGVRRNQRGLLEHVLRPVLADRESLVAHRFPQARLAVDLPEPTYWTEFEQRYAGSWPPENRHRIKLLAQAWVPARSDEEAARNLERLLDPFGFPPFSRAVVKRDEELEETNNPESTSNDQEPSRKRAEPSPEPPELQTLLKAVAQWSGEAQARLDYDDEPRRAVLEFIKKSVVWDDVAVPTEVWQRLLEDKRCIRFDDQRSKASGTFFIDLPRSEESAALVGALGRFRYLGRGKWNFPGGELHKRVASAWLRTRGPAIVASMHPPAPLDRQAPIQYAVRFLSTTALLRRGADFESDSVKVVREVLTDLPQEVPPTLDGGDATLIESLWRAHGAVKEFLIHELSVPQGESRGGDLFIDPLPILQHARATFDTPVVPPLGPAFTGASAQYWRTRYQSLAGLEPLANLPHALAPRRAAISDGVTRVRLALLDAGVSGDDLSDGIATYCAQLTELLKAEEQHVKLSDREFAPLRPLYGERGAEWGAAIAAAAKLADGEAGVRLWTFAVRSFVEARDAIVRAHAYVDALQREVAAQEAALVADGDPESVFRDLHDALKRVLDDGVPTGTDASPQAQVAVT